MDIEIRCPHCQKKYRLPETYRERAIKCKVCGYPFFVLVPGVGKAREQAKPANVAGHFEKAKAAEETRMAMPAVDPKAPPKK